MDSWNHEIMASWNNGIEELAARESRTATGLVEGIKNEEVKAKGKNKEVKAQRDVVAIKQ